MTATSPTPDAEVDHTNMFLQATQYVSHQQLQQFMLSLTGSELKRMVHFYLKHAIVSRHKNQTSKETYKQAVQRLISDTTDTAESTNAHHVADQSILRKMRKQYINTYSTKVVRRMTQKHSPHTHLSSISPQTLAYCFQFLRFREVCSIESTCAYFKHLHAVNPQHCHYHLYLDKQILQQVVRGNLNLRSLRQFKSIHVSVHYLSTRQHARDYVFKRIVEQSLSSLDKLQLNGNDRMLMQIMNSLDSLRITQLNCDGSIIVADNLLLCTQFPHLERVRLQRAEMCPSLQLSEWRNLRWLCLDCTGVHGVNAFSRRWDVLSKVSSIASLHTLQVSTHLDGEPLAQLRSDLRNWTLQTLQITFEEEHSRRHYQSISHTKDACARAILKQCCGIFRGITSFALLQGTVRSRPRDFWTSEWSVWLMSCLLTNRRHLQTPVPVLQSLELCLFPTEAIRLLSHLVHSQSVCLDLRSLSLDIEFESTAQTQGRETQLDDFLQNDLSRFLPAAANLESFELRVCKRYSGRGLPLAGSMYWTVDSHMVSVLRVLCNLPNSLQNFSLKWESQQWNNRYVYEERREKTKSQRLVKKLCELSIAPGNLHSVCLPDFLLDPLHRKYLDFHFGFGDHLAHKRKYGANFSNLYVMYF